MGKRVALHEACADRDAVGRRLTAAAERLGTTELRVAASSVQYQLAERLWDVTLISWSLGVVLHCNRLRVGPGHESWDIAVSFDEAGEPTTAGLVSALDTLHDTIRSWTPVAEGLLWGNAAAAANWALSRLDPGATRDRAVALVDAALSDEPLRHRLAGPVGGDVVRRSCCLYYRSCFAEPCRDCPLAESAVTRRAAAIS